MCAHIHTSKTDGKIKKKFRNKKKCRIQMKNNAIGRE